MSEVSIPNRNDAILVAKELGRLVAGKSLVNDVSFAIHSGELLGIVGPSGSGKSSLLRLLNRLDEPTSGTVFLDNIDFRQLPPRELRRRVGMVTQRPFLFPGDVAGNLRFGPAQRGEVLSDEEVSRLLDRVGLPGFAAQDSSVLSGGEQQRVSLARTLANRPDVLLLDEPTSALDEQSKLGIEELIATQVRDHHLTCIMVTHDHAQARRLCRRVIVLEAGHIVHDGPVLEVLGAQVDVPL
jgi:putative ABC transport system ATP-binding protein